MRILNIADFHIKAQADTELSLWEYKVYEQAISEIKAIVEKENIDRLNILGDILDSPQLTKGQLNILVKLFSIDVEKVLIGGNHEYLARGVYIYESMGDFLSAFNVKYIDTYWYDSNIDAWYVNHKALEQIPKLKKATYLFSHFRSGLGDIAPDEIDLNYAGHFKQIIAGDIHNPIDYRNVSYVGSLVCVNFQTPPQQPSLLILDTESGKITRRKLEVPKKLVSYALSINDVVYPKVSDNNFTKIVIEGLQQDLTKLKDGTNYFFEKTKKELNDSKFETIADLVSEQLSTTAKGVEADFLSFTLRQVDARYHDLITNMVAQYQLNYTPEVVD